MSTEEKKQLDELGAAIRAGRDQNEVTLLELSRHLGAVTWQYAQGLESGTHTPSRANLKRLCEKLGLDFITAARAAAERHRENKLRYYLKDEEI